MKQIISYDFLSDNSVTAVAEVCEMANVRPITISFNPTIYDNVTIEFNSTEDAIKFTEVYLDSDDPADIMEYVVDDSIQRTNNKVEELKPLRDPYVPFHHPV